MTDTGADPRQRDATVRVVGVSVSYGRVAALQSVDLTAEQGRLLAVTGPSGAGKSTLLWVIAGAVRAGPGQVSVGGFSIDGRDRAVREGVGLIPQGNGLATVLTARENIAIPLLSLGIRAGEAHRMTEEALTEVDLDESGDHLVEELSGGQQQRVAVARGLALRSRVLLADEPTSELDHVNRERVLALLREQADQGAVVIMATHDPEAAAVADAEVRLDEGRLTTIR
jgi:putative ABC transport system ATP-binding protein